MKALLLTNLYPSLRQPTRGPYNHNIFNSLSRRCETRVVMPEPWWSRIGHPGELLHLPEERQTGLAATLPTYWSIPRVTALHARAMYWSLRPHLKRLHRSFAFDVILAAWAYPDAVAASMLADDFGCPLVINVLGSDINELTRHPTLRGQIRRGLMKAHRVIAVSAALRDKVVEIGIPADRVVTQHNGVDGDRFAIRDRRIVRAQLGLPIDKPLICYVGRLGHEKGIDVLIEAMDQVRRSGPEVQLALVGGGKMEGPLRARVASLGLGDQVHFYGMRPHTEVPDWVSACDVLVLPSRREGCPNVILEALASGRPVVASGVGGIPELLTQGRNGLMVPSDDAPALAHALQSALEQVWDPQALRDTVEFLSWDAVADNYYGFLADAVAHRRSGASGLG